MMTSPVIMLDLDDTLCDLSSGLQKALYFETGKDIPVSKWHCYDLGKVYGVDGRVVESAIVHHNLFHWVRPFEKVVESLTNFKKSGYDLVIVTARQSLDLNGAITNAWLKEHGVEYDELILTTHSLGKKKIAESIRPEWSIDDNVAYTDGCQEFVENTVIQNRPWNIGASNNPFGFNRVDHFFEFADMVIDNNLEQTKAMK